MVLFSDADLSAKKMAESGRGQTAVTDKRRHIARLIFGTVSIIVLVMVWGLAAWLAHSRHFPDPLTVAARIVSETESGQLPYQVGVTLARVAASFALAIAIGSPVGFVMGRYPKIDLFFDSWLIFFLNLPALIVIILCFLWIGLNEVAAITAVALNKIPNVAVIMREGTQALARPYDDMASVYRFSWWTRLRDVHVPQLAPYFAVAARSGLAIVWKIVLVVELLGLSSGVGFKLNTYFQLFDVTGILAYSVSFIAVIFVIETLLLRPWQIAANRWRQ